MFFVGWRWWRTRVWWIIYCLLSLFLLVLAVLFKEKIHGEGAVGHWILVGRILATKVVVPTSVEAVPAE